MIKMPKIAITISYTENWNELAAIVIPNTAEYCARHGYSLFVTVEKPYGKYSGLEKLRNVKNLLLDFDVIFSLDCDTLITNHEVRLESFITEDEDFFICAGWNMGVFAIRISGFGVELIDFMIEEIKSGRCHCEQDAIAKIPINDPHIKVLEHPAFNSFIPELYGHIKEPEKITEKEGRWMPGHFILHLPSLGMSERIKLLNEYKEKIVR